MGFTKEEILENKKRQYKRKKVISIFIYIIIIPVIIYNITLIAKSLKHPNKTPSFLGIKTFVIVSGSMEPTFKAGDVIFVKDLTEEQITPGTVISFREGHSVITHRVVEVIENEGKKEYITKGDNNNVKDSFSVKHNDIEGTYITKASGVGKFVLFFQNKIVIITIMLIFYFLYISDSGKKQKSFMRRKKKEKFNKQLQKLQEET